MHDGVMTTYTQAKLGLSAYYDKRHVLEDGIHTEPLEYHMLEKVKEEPDDKSNPFEDYYRLEVEDHEDDYPDDGCQFW